MTVAAEIPLALYDGDGVTVAFPAPWRYLDVAHLLVERVAADGAETLLALGVDYAATAGPTDAGGTVTTTVAPAVGQKLRIRRVTPEGQPTQYPTTGSFPAASHELALDRLTLIGQEQTAAIARAALVPPGESGPKLMGLPGAVANSVLAFDPASGSWRPVGEGDWIAWRESARADIQEKGDEQVGLVEAAGANILDAVAAVVQRIPFAIQDDNGLNDEAYYFEFFAATTTTYTEWNAGIFLGTGSVDILVHVNDLNVYGPRTVSSVGPDTDTPNLTIAKGSRVSVQISNVTGTPKLVAGQLLGYPS